MPSVSGLVFVDLDQNGTQDPGEVGVPNVLVTATEADGTTTTATTDTGGAYTLDTNSTAVRLEFSAIPEGLIVGKSTPTTGATVRFVDASTDPTDVNLGLNSYLVALNTYFYDKATTGVAAGEGAIVTVEYAADGVQTPNVLATYDQVGSTFGLAYQPQSNSLYASSFVKRHAGLGPNTLDPDATTVGTTTGGIYRIDRTNGNEVSILLDMNNIPAGIIPAGSTATNFATGADPHPVDADIDGGDWLHDAATVSKVGKIGLGGLAVSADGRTMYTINLNTRELIEIPVNVDGTLDTTRKLRRTPVPLTNPGGITSFSAADLRPFAVTVKGNAVFVGETYTSQSQSGATAKTNLRAIVYAFNPATGTFSSYNGATSTFTAGTTPVISAPLNYNRGFIDQGDPDVTTDNASGNWNGWTDTFTNQTATTGSVFTKPMPWLTDIAFDGNNMVLGLRDRFGDMGGYQLYTTDTNGTDPINTVGGGDILRAALNTSGASAGSWSLESNGSSGGVTTGGAGNGQGPGGGEYYYQDDFNDITQEATTGGLAQVPGYQTIVSSGIDTQDADSGGVYTLLNSDTDPSASVNTAGTTFARGETYLTSDFSTFGSANGVGNVEVLASDAGIQVGDRVFNDANNNGIQDAGEAGISGVVLGLFKNGTQVSSATTDVDGNYLFESLDPSTAYEIRISTTQTALAGKSIAKTTQGTDTAIDSNATVSGTTATVAFTTGGAGTSDHTLDVGFTGAAAGTLTLGNQVFVDANNNGTFDTGEVGIAGVTVQLINSGGTVAGTTTTGANGIYTFTGLAAGTYRVRIAASNFSTGAILAGYTSSTGTGGAFETNNPPNPDLNVDNDDNGITDTTGGALGAGGFIQSGPVTLSVGGEPVNDGDTDANTNLTLDFGVVAPAAAGNLTLGNQVFVDANNNGVLDTGETGLAGVTVQLINSGGTVAATTTTGANGIYTFTGLAAGTYRVRIAASNFNTGSVLSGYTSSTGTGGAFETNNPPDPNLNVDNDDNGITDTTAGALGAGGFIQSGPVTLSVGGEPVNDGDTDANTNLTLDFGVVAPAAAGNLTLGNQVFVDANNNGILDSGETGLSGVTVQLINSGGTVSATTTTGANGIYTFTGLAAGIYRVRIAASNFSTGAVLAGYTSSTGTNGAFETTNPPDPNLNVDNDDNGITDTTAGALGAGGFIQSGPVTLSVGGEPVNDGDADANTNMTLDFGVVAPAAGGTLSLGNTVFNDVNDNGILDSGESGIAGVTVQLISSTGTVLQSATTVAGGQYTFTGLTPGDYRVRIAASNFTAGGTLVGFVSSVGVNGAYETNNPPDPNNNIDGDDNGITDTSTGALGAGGFIQSPPINLAVGAEPTNDGDSSANTNLTLDFGVRQPTTANTLTLGNQVFVDTNNNGVLDTGETGLAGVTLQLINSSGTVVASTVSAANGIYSFANLNPGTYRVRIAASNFNSGAVLSGYTSSTGTGGAFETTNPPDPNLNVNNDDNGITDTTAGALGAGGFIQSKPITLSLGGEPVNDGDTDANTNLTLDFGVVAPAAAGTLSLGNTVFNDVNNNGLLDNGEAGISGVTVQLISSAGAVLQTATTDSAGQYTFTNLAAGNYKVRIAATNFTTTGTPGALAGFTSSTGTNGSATGTYEATPPLDPNNNIDSDDNGVIVSTGGALGAGGYIESGTITLAAGTEPVNDGDTSADTNLTLDFGVFRKFSIGNTVFNDLNNNGIKDGNESGIGNVTVQLLSTATGNPVVATTTTNSSGQYLFTNLIAGDYIVRLAATNFNTGGALATFQSSTGGTGSPFEGAATPDPDTTPTDNDDNGTTITTAGALGAGGVIQSLPVTLGPTANEPTGETSSNDTTTPDNQSNLTVDFGVFQQVPATASVSGRVFLDYDNSGTFNGPDTGISGVTITLTGGNLTAPMTVTTDASGNYSFTNLAAGTYTVTETQPTTPANQTGKVTVGTSGGNSTTTANTISSIGLGANAQATGYNFGEVPLVSTGGSVYEDTNGNGVKDSGETGISGVTVTLTGTNVVTGAITPVVVTTDSSGNYTFSNILPGTYTIAETQPAGFNDGQEQNGTPAAASVSADRFVGINLTTSAATSGGFNFGEVKASGLSGTVFADLNNNGTKDTGETGIAGVTLKLTGTSNGVAVSKTATTGADGTYSFTNLGPGTYAITETQPTKYLDGIETAGTSGGTAATNAINAITLASGATATGYNFGELVAPDLTITQSESPPRPKPGTLVTFTYTVTNNGTGPATAATANINLAGFTFVSSSDSTAFDSSTSKWTIGDVAAGASETLTITARVPNAPGRYRPSSSVSATNTETVSTNNSTTTVISAGLGVSLQSYLASLFGH